MLSQAILYHELALVVSGAGGGGSRLGTAQIRSGVWTLAVLWAMRLSAKLNLFLGVPILNDQFLPSHLQYLTSFFTRGRLNFLFPVVITGSTIVTAALVARALASDASAFDAVGFTLLATLMALAVVEHWFMVLAAAGRTALELGHAFARRGIGGMGSQIPDASQRLEQRAVASESADRVAAHGSAETGRSNSAGFLRSQ